MASVLKAVSKFSTDAITLALNNLPPEEKQAFLNGLSCISAILGERQSKQSDGKTKPKITDEDIFSTQVLPQIQKRIAEIEAEEMKQHLAISINFDIETNYDALTIHDLKKLHTKIVGQEQNLKEATLLVQFFRGQLYLTLNKKARKENLLWKKFVKEEIGCSYMTVLRYMTLAIFVSSYPRLLLGNLTFAQILKHRKRISKYLDSEDGMSLRDQLSMSFDLNLQGNTIHIGWVSVPTPPKQTFDFSPDWEYQDRSRMEAPNTKAEKWIESVGSSGIDVESNPNQAKELEEYLGLVP